MNRKNRLLNALTIGGVLSGLVVGLTGPVAHAQPASSTLSSSRGSADASLQREHLDRGLVAVSTTEGVFVSWRLLSSEATGTTATGVVGPDFQVLRDGNIIATVTDSTNYLDTGGTAASTYSVIPIVNGIAGATSPTVSAAAENHLSIPLRKPADGVTPKGEAYTYFADDTSVADVDGDGAYEFVVKWDPSNSKDVSQKGYTGEVFIDTYKLDGMLLNRISLGANIRAGAHYTQFLAYDFDGDGRSELMLKTAPGTKTTTYDQNGAVTSERYITLPKKDVKAGVTNQDDYRLSNEDYRVHLAEMFEGWATRPEVTSGTWPATLEEAWGIPVTHTYPLTKEAARELADYYIDVWAPTRSTRNELWNYEGFILDGPEYLTVFDGASGRELATTAYEPSRGDDGLLWGDYAGTRIEPGNRVDRFLSGVSYLDGQHPSAIFARGYYTRTTIAAYDWNGKRITQRWFVDSGHVPMTNPFNDAPHGRDGTDPEFKEITNQGFHSLSSADVDADGKQEIVYGSATIDDDGSLLYSSFGMSPTGPGGALERRRLGHGDALHVADIDPNRPGLEIMTVHENTWAPYAIALRDAATGEVIWGEYTGVDTQRGLVGDVRPDVPGLEAWSGSLVDTAQKKGLLSAQGERIDLAMPSSLQSIRWAADLTSQVYGPASSTDLTPTITDWTRGPVLTATGSLMKSSTVKASLVADVLGDWREELLVPAADHQSMRIYTSTEVTMHKLPTLMHDLQYRAEAARQQTVYNQPLYTSFYLASDMDFSKVPLLTQEVTPGTPKFKDHKGTKSDKVTLPKTDGVDWYVDGRYIERSRTVDIRNGAVVVARVQDGYRFRANATWSWTFTSTK